MSEAGWTAIIVGVGTLITALATAAVMILNARHKNQQEREASALKGLQDFCDRLQGSLADHQQVIDELYNEHASCQAQMGELWGWMLCYHDIAVRLARVAEAAGEGKVEVPPMPERPTRRERPEFLQRTAAANTSLANAVGNQIRQTGQGPGTAP